MSGFFFWWVFGGVGGGRGGGRSRGEGLLRATRFEERGTGTRQLFFLQYIG